MIHEEQNEVTVNDLEEGEIYNEFKVLVIEKGDVSVFRGTDGLPFELIMLTKAYNLQTLTNNTKIVGNFLTENERNNRSIIFIQDPKWEGGNTLFMHPVCDKDENIFVC